jgi:hypothetical protein
VGNVVRFRVTLVALAMCCGCSAIIEPDVTRLGGDGGGGTDAGMRDGGMDDGGMRDAGREPDAGPMCPPSCDDSIGCTTDACEDFECVNTPVDSACGDGERCSPVLDCVPEVCTRDQECDDNVFCNGVERCVDGAPGTGCVAGDPVDCPEDDAACSTAMCDEAEDACGFRLDHAMCADVVGCTEDACVAERGCVHEADDRLCEADFCTVNSTCDASAGCSPGTRRSCDDGSPCTDDSCSDALEMCVNELRDGDGDGFTVATIAGMGPPITCGGTDCDDTNMMIFPGATELCNRVDDNCNGMVDEGCPVAVPGDDCASPIVISLTGGTTMASRTGMFSTFTDSYQTSSYCEAATGGRDVVYAIDLPLGLYDVTIDTSGSAADTVLAVAFECSATGFSGVCNDDMDSNAGTASRIWLHRFGSNAGPSRFYVLVDTFGSSDTRGYALNVRRQSVLPDTCPTGGGASPLEISGGGAVVGFNTAASSFQRGSCSPLVDFGSESIFRFRRATAGNVNFDVFSLDFTPDAYIRRAPCSSGTEIGCEEGRVVTGTLSNVLIRRNVVATELHYLFVDGGPGNFVVYYEPF